MIFEDDPIILWDLESKLHTLDCEITEVYEGVAAYTDNFHSTEVDIVIANLRLNDGWVSKSMLQLLSSSGRGMLILTGLGDEFYYDTLDLEVPYRFLIKPYTHHQLKRSLLQLRKAS